MTAKAPVSGGAQGGRLLTAAGIFTLVNNYLPGSGHLDLAVLNTIAAVAIALGLLLLRMPWERMHPRAPLAMTPVAFALLSLSNLYGDVSAYSYAIYFVVVFVWVGIAQPPRTSWWIMPMAAAAYLLPFLVGDDPPPNAIASVTVAIPVCVLVGEVLARSVRRLDDSRLALRRRVELVERLTGIATELGADLDVARTQDRLCLGAQELFEATGVMTLTVSGGQARVVSSVGTAPPAGAELTIHGGSELERALGGATIQVIDVRDCGLEGDNRLAVVPCRPGPPAVVLGLLLDASRQLGREDIDLLRLLVAQARAALGNATRHAAVVAQREHEQAVVDVLADGVLVLDAQGQLLSCNDVAAALLGGTANALPGSVPVLLLGGDGDAVQTQVGGRWIETVATTLTDVDERVVTLRDISRQRALDEAKDLFLATTSHELRTPLTAVKGYVNMLQRRWDVLDEPARLEALGTIAQRTDDLVALTNHLLLGARAGASRHSAASVTFELGGAVAASAKTYAHVSARHEVRLDVGSTPVQALGDPGSVEHIVGQLVENAVKYSPLGGTVEVSVRCEGRFAVVEVADEGIGLPVGEELSLFAPFFQAGATNTREFGGVGLGLYIVRQLVEAQGGEVIARNRPDVGSVLGFTLPLAPDPPRPRSGGQPAARSVGTAAYDPHRKGRGDRTKWACAGGEAAWPSGWRLPVGSCPPASGRCPTCCPCCGWPGCRSSSTGCWSASRTAGRCCC